ncbi:MAG: hypothetical protein P4L54_01770 [Acidocella sp.]|nr:hypothetical protein [Acidocella sp.]
MKKLFVIVLVACTPLLARADGSDLPSKQVTVPAILCSENIVSPRESDTQPLPPPDMPDGGIVQVDLSESVASKLEAYIYDLGILLAPRGWHCDYSVLGGYGAIASVHPNGNNPNYYGIGASFNYTQGYEAGRQIAQVLANTYFPAEMKRLYADHPDYLDTTETNKTYKTDQIKYESDMELDFKTPAHQIGFESPEKWSTGTDKKEKLLRIPLNVPIDGFLSLAGTPNDHGLCHVFSYSVILPPNLYDLDPYLIRDEKSRPEAMPSTNSTNC